MAAPGKLTRFYEFGKKIICIGRNYREHAAELGNPVPTEPLLFSKPTTAYIREGQNIQIPRGCSSLHHEVELGVVIGKTGKNIHPGRAMNHVGGYVLALDMTARDLQAKAKKKGHPWLIAKGFDTSCPVSEFIPLKMIPDPNSVQLWLKVNGATRQDGTTADMIFGIAELLSYISTYFTLEEGDLVLTGTPSGVGEVVEGDVITCGLGNLAEMSFSVENPHKRDRIQLSSVD
ncbi:PREDICTED: acylpyruvase FAHD1, mitochondrial-like [Priapulus caudatus]|uniref:oxaloacetate tautomerase n=1 Tax=Priapulus caudatus TaxID=37621 RepID=A0ABM1E8M5_PRICU|nr:PREDICTED: acylpyruvase FAHD1, mitochondrial-like [Priapulus caudatus]